LGQGSNKSNKEEDITMKRYPKAELKVLVDNFTAAADDCNRAFDSYRVTPVKSFARWLFDGLTGKGFSL